MMNDIFTLMKFELIVTVIIFILLFLKIGRDEMKNDAVLNLINFLLLINFVAGFFFNWFSLAMESFAWATES